MKTSRLHTKEISLPTKYLITKKKEIESKRKNEEHVDEREKIISKVPVRGSQLIEAKKSLNEMKRKITIIEDKEHEETDRRRV